MESRSLRPYVLEFKDDAYEMQDLEQLQTRHGGCHMVSAKMGALPLE